MYSTYIKLHANVNPGEFEKKLRFIITDRLGPFVAENYKLDLKEWYSRGNKIDLMLMPVSKIHLYADHIAGFEDQNNISTVILIVSAAALILFIACFNFINFNVSLFRKSCKSVGIRKICGSDKSAILLQAFMEAFIVFILSAAAALFIISSARPIITGLIKPALVSFQTIKHAIPILLIFGVLVSFICGCLPFLRSIKRNPSFLIKSNLRFSNRNITIGRVFFGLQFMVSIVLLIFFFVINRQINLITTYDLGFTKEDVLIIHRTDRDRNEARILADELRKLPGIKAVSVTNAYPGSGLPTKELRLKDSPGGTSYSPQYLCCDREMIHVLNLKIIEGEFFSKNSPENSILLNEAALKTYGIKENPTGQIFTHSSGKYIYSVIGTVKDFNFRSLHKNIEPLCIYTGTDYSNSMDASKVLVKIATKERRIIEAVKEKWNAVYKDSYFDYSFLEDEINAQYEKEVLLKKIIPVFMLLAFIISAIGLIGITYIKMDEKIKEIGIRKVNGAKVTEILTLLNRDFIKWTAIAFVVACPIAWYAMHKWLQDFAYKTALSWWIFAAAGAAAVTVALLTVSWQSWKAATRNPVKALRYE